MPESIDSYLTFLRAQGATFEVSEGLIRDPDHDAVLLPDGPRPRSHGDLLEQQILELDDVDTALGSDYATNSVAREIVRLGSQMAGKRFLDLGCGTGILGIVAAKLSAEVSSTDIDDLAVELSLRNAVLNDVALDVRQGSLTEPISDDEKFAFVVANLPHKPALIGSGELPLGQAGGPEGDEIWSLAIPEIVDHLEDEGRLLFFLHSLPHPRIFALFGDYFDLRLLRWKIRWFQDDEFANLRPLFAERHRLSTSFLWQSADRLGLVAGVWQGTKKRSS